MISSESFADLAGTPMCGSRRKRDDRFLLNPGRIVNAIAQNIACSSCASWIFGFAENLIHEIGAVQIQNDQFFI